jgi:hypothetical protein
MKQEQAAYAALVLPSTPSSPTHERPVDDTDQAQALATPHRHRW